MDKQVLFFAALSVLLIYNGVIKFNPIFQIAGILLIVFLIYDVSINSKNYNIPKLKYRKRFNFIAILGNVDLIFGLLIILDILYGIVPHIFLFIVAVFILLKALPFVFHRDIASIMDIVIVLLIIFNSPVLAGVKIAMAIYFIQKGALTYFG
ncbi:MAG: hypothetical protein QF381_02995 [Nitrososphaerales archaeon]|jgi:hypothetical protein|nr:hypothetical protein [Nitrososphaerales archaeon]